MVSSGEGVGAGIPPEDEACLFHMNVLSGKAGNPPADEALVAALVAGIAHVVVRARDKPCDHAFR